MVDAYAQDAEVVAALRTIGDSGTKPMRGGWSLQGCRPARRRNSRCPSFSERLCRKMDLMVVIDAGRSLGWAVRR
jgi:hypothetical protein